MKSGRDKTIELKDLRREREIYKTRCPKRSSKAAQDKINCLLREFRSFHVGKENPLGTQRLVKRNARSINANPQQSLCILKVEKKPSLLYPDTRKMHRVTSSYSKVMATQRHRKNLSEHEQDLINKLAGIKSFN